MCRSAVGRSWLSSGSTRQLILTVTTRPLTPPKPQAAIGHVGQAGVMSRRLQRRVAGWLVGVLLLAQMAVASYACPALSAALRSGQAPQAAVQAMAATMPDCSEMAGALDPGSANLCAEHCKYGQQSDQTPSLVPPVALLMLLYTTPPAAAAALPGATAAAQAAQLAPPPGHAVLHCVYRL